MTDYIIHTDGGIRGNPGPAASAAVFHWQNGMFNISKFHYGTNNDAEYVGLLLALDYLVEFATKGATATIHMDSQLVVRQISREYVCRSSLLRHWEEAITKIAILEERGVSVSVVHVPREQNEEADMVCNTVLLEHGYPKKGWTKK